MTPWTADQQAPWSMTFSRQEHWSGLPFPTPQGIWMLNKWGNIQMTGGHSDMELREYAWT